MNLKIREYAHGDTAISYDEGVRCFNQIKTGIENEEMITLDFEGIKFVITAFLNPIIGDVILNYGTEGMGKINIINSTPDILNKIKIVKDGALLKREDINE